MLKKLHEEFIERANRPMDFGALPVEPKEPEAPVLAVNRWKIVDGRLAKTYMFRRAGDRDRFILGILSYEKEVGHRALVVMQDDKVALRLVTHDVNQVTELDKEYARSIDLLYRDIVYSV